GGGGGVAGPVRGRAVPAPAGRDRRHGELRRRAVPARHRQGRRPGRHRRFPGGGPELPLPPVLPVQQFLAMPAGTEREHHHRTGARRGTALTAQSSRVLGSAGTSTAYPARVARGTISSARSWVDASTTGAAAP